LGGGGSEKVADLGHEEVGGGAVGEEGYVAGVEGGAAGVVEHGGLEEELAVGVVAGVLLPLRLRRPLVLRLHRRCRVCPSP
jgi:hypothetical protein